MRGRAIAARLGVRWAAGLSGRWSGVLAGGLVAAAVGFTARRLATRGFSAARGLAAAGGLATAGRLATARRIAAGGLAAAMFRAVRGSRSRLASCWPGLAGQVGNVKFGLATDETLRIV